MFLSDPDVSEGKENKQGPEEKGKNNPSQEKHSETEILESHSKTTSWYSLENEVIFKKLATSSRGLDPEEVAIRLK